jgi:cytochrome P450 family 4
MWGLSLLSPTILALLVSILVVVYWRHRSRARMVRLIDKIPGPPSLPVIGNAIEMNVEHDGTCPSVHKLTLPSHIPTI